MLVVQAAALVSRAAPPGWQLRAWHARHTVAWRGAVHGGKRGGGQRGGMRGSRQQERGVHPRGGCPLGEVRR